MLNFGRLSVAKLIAPYRGNTLKQANNKTEFLHKNCVNSNLLEGDLTIKEVIDYDK